jgi:hypothetical protein
LRLPKAPIKSSFYFLALGQLIDLFKFFIILNGPMFLLKSLLSHCGGQLTLQFSAMSGTLAPCVWRQVILLLPEHVCRLRLGLSSPFAKGVNLFCKIKVLISCVI